MELFEKTADSTIIYKGKIFTVKKDRVILANGKTADRETVIHRGGAGILPIDENGNVTLVRQYRYGVGKVLTEMCAGKLEAGENPLESAKRELGEELGLTAKNIISLGQVIPTPAYDSEIIYIYLATGLSKTETHFDDDEFLEPVRLPLAGAVRMVYDGEITDAKTQIALLKAEKLWKK